MKSFLGCLFLLLLTGSASAEIVKYGRPSAKGIDLFWWPKLSPPKGWMQDTPASEENGINVLVPKGASFSNSDVVIYGRACYKPNWDQKTLTAFIAYDKKDSMNQFPSQHLTEASQITEGDGVKMRTIEFFPTKKGNWERVAYLEEGQFYVVFTLSSRTKSGYASTLPVFLDLLRKNRK